MGSENGAYLSTSPQILPVSGLYLSHLTRGSFSFNRLTIPSSNLCSCHPRLSAFLQLSQSPTVVIFDTSCAKKCARPRTHPDARVVEIQGRPEIFPRLLAENVDLQRRSSQSYRESKLQVQFLYRGDLPKFARECELEGLGGQ